jgi:hypothetical protein
MTEQEWHNYIWNRAIRLEPRLDELVKLASSISDSEDRNFCNFTIWSGGYRNIPPFYRSLFDILRDGRLRTSPFRDQVYEVGAAKIEDALPPCRNSACRVCGGRFVLARNGEAAATETRGNSSK